MCFVSCAINLDVHIETCDIRRPIGQTPNEVAAGRWRIPSAQLLTICIPKTGTSFVESWKVFMEDPGLLNREKICSKN